MDFDIKLIKRHEDLTGEGNYCNEVITYNNVIVAIRCDGSLASAAVCYIDTDANADTIELVRENQEEFEGYLNEHYNLELDTSLRVSEEDEEEEEEEEKEAKDSLFITVAQTTLSNHAHSWVVDMKTRVTHLTDGEIDSLYQLAALLDMDDNWGSYESPTTRHMHAQIISDIATALDGCATEYGFLPSLIYPLLRNPTWAIRDGGIKSALEDITNLSSS